MIKINIAGAIKKAREDLAVYEKLRKANDDGVVGLREGEVIVGQTKENSDITICFECPAEDITEELSKIINKKGKN